MSYEKFTIKVRFDDCCKDCVPPKRHLHCHSTCPEYLGAKAKHDAEAKLIRDSIAAEQIKIKQRKRKGSWQLGGGWRDDR